MPSPSIQSLWQPRKLSTPENAQLRSGPSGLSVLSALARWLRRRRDLQLLQSLDDHLLKDIGLNRGNLMSAVWGRDHHG